MKHVAIQQRIAAHAAIVKHESVNRADAAAKAVATSVDAVWLKLWRVTSPSKSWADNQRAAVEVFRELLATLHGSIGVEIRKAFATSHKAMASRLAESIPGEQLDQAAAAKALANRRSRSGWAVIRESLSWLFERRKPATADDKEAFEASVAHMLFGAPTEERTRQVIMGSPASDGQTWQQRLQGMSKKIDSPEAMAGQLAAGLAAGENRQELIKRIKPNVQNVRSSAARIARTEGLRVAQAGIMDSFEALGPLLDGYQIRATLDLVTRPGHASRNGLIWRKKSGQSMRQALRMKGDTLPDEPNCRCWLVPILKPPNEPIPKEVEGVFLKPEVDTYREWFDRQPERIQKQVVTAKRWKEARGKLGRKPSWEHFLDPATQDLVSHEQLKTETADAMRARRDAVRKEQTLQKKRIEEVQRIGFLPTKGPLAFPVADGAAIAKQPAGVTLGDVFSRLRHLTYHPTPAGLGLVPGEVAAVAPPAAGGTFTMPVPKPIVTKPAKPVKGRRAPKTIRGSKTRPVKPARPARPVKI